MVQRAVFEDIPVLKDILRSIEAVAQTRRDVNALAAKSRKAIEDSRALLMRVDTMLGHVRSVGA